MRRRSFSSKLSVVDNAAEESFQAQIEGFWTLVEDESGAIRKRPS